MQRKFLLLIISFLMISEFGFGQKEGCDIKNIVEPDGTMYYYAAMDTFYFNQTKQLMGGMITGIGRKVL